MAADISAGLFFIMIVMAFGFMFAGIQRMFNYSKFFTMLSLALFTGLSLFMAQGRQVVSEKTITDGSATWTETNILISTDGYWLAYIFMGLAILNVILFINNIWRVESN